MAKRFRFEIHLLFLFIFNSTAYGISFVYFLFNCDFYVTNGLLTMYIIIEYFLIVNYGLKLIFAIIETLVKMGRPLLREQ